MQAQRRRDRKSERCEEPLETSQTNRYKSERCASQRTCDEIWTAPSSGTRSLDEPNKHTGSDKTDFYMVENSYAVVVTLQARNVHQMIGQSRLRLRNSAEVTSPMASMASRVTRVGADWMGKRSTV